MSLLLSYTEKHRQRWEGEEKHFSLVFCVHFLICGKKGLFLVSSVEHLHILMCLYHITLCLVILIAMYCILSLISGYYNRPWLWEQIKQNTQWIIQFGSTDDPFIPFSEQQQVAEGTAAEFYQFSDKGHFMSMAFPELINKLLSKLQQG